VSFRATRNRVQNLWWAGAGVEGKWYFIFLGCCTNGAPSLRQFGWRASTLILPRPFRWRILNQSVASPEPEFKSLPPVLSPLQVIISIPLQAATCRNPAAGALLVPIAFNCQCLDQTFPPASKSGVCFAIHFGLQLLSSDRALPIILESLRLAQVIGDFILNLLLERITNTGWQPITDHRSLTTCDGRTRTVVPALDADVEWWLASGAEATRSLAHTVWLHYIGPACARKELAAKIRSPRVG